MSSGSRHFDVMAIHFRPPLSEETHSNCHCFVYNTSSKHFRNKMFGSRGNKPRPSQPEWYIRCHMAGNTVSGARSRRNQFYARRRLTRSGKMLDKVSGRTQYSEGREAIVHDMVEAISVLRDRFGKENLSGIGIGVPGFISLKEGIIKNCAANIPALENFSDPRRDRAATRDHRHPRKTTANAQAALGEKWIWSGPWRWTT